MAAGLPGGVGAVPQIWYSQPKRLRRDCDGRRDDDLRLVIVGGSLSLLWALERFGEARMGRGGCHTFWIQLAQHEGSRKGDLKAVWGCWSSL